MTGVSGRQLVPPEGTTAGDDLYRQIFERNRTVQLLIDPATGRIVDANPAACRFYGYSREDLTTRKISDINALPPADVTDALARAASGVQSRFQFQHRLASGDVRKVEVETGPVEMDGRVLLYSVVHDVSDRHEAEAELNRNISLLQSTLESTTDGILVIDPGGQILTSNQRFAQMWRIPPVLLEPGEHTKALEYVRDQLKDPEQFAARIKELYADPEAQSFDVLEFKDGRVFERYSMPQRLDGAPVGRVWRFRDVTERRQGEEALRQSEEKYREILAGIAEGYYEVDLQGHLTFFNDALGRILGYRAEEMKGMSYRRFIDRRSTRDMYRLFRGDFSTGQPVGYVDWKILGRNDRLYVKQFEEETNLRAMVVCDASRSMAWTGAPGSVLPKLAYAQRLIAALSLVLLRQRDATGLITFDDEVRTVLPPRARLSHWHQLLQTLGALQAGQGTAAEPALRRVVDQLRRRGLVVFVSDLLLDRGLALKALRFLRHRGHQVLVLHIMDPAEVALGGPAEARFEDPETRASVVLRPRDWAGAYRDTVNTVVGEWRLACRRHGIGYHLVITDTPYGIVLREALAPSRVA